MKNLVTNQAETSLHKGYAGTSLSRVRRGAGLFFLPAAITCAGLVACSGDGNRATSPGSDAGPATSDATTPSGDATGPGAGSTGDATSGDSGNTPPDSGNPGGDSGADAGLAQAVRTFIGMQVGGIANLTVPPDDKSIPVPPDDPTRPGRYDTTPAKKYLGKLLFHDPVRTVRINKNSMQPLDLPAGTAFGGTVAVPDGGSVQNIVNATIQTGSCGSCHIGEAAGKAGQVLNFNVGGEGRGYTDQNGHFFPRRRPMLSVLTRLRTEPLFPGDQLVDALPTLTDIFSVGGHEVVTTPALFYHSPRPDALLMSGRLDELDSVGRQSPSMVGFAFNNRLLFGGLGGEPQTTIGGLNPLNDPAQENLTLLLLDAHRMLNFESAALLQIPAFVQAFKDAFPTEAANAADAGDMTQLVNDQTVLRATATFLRTVVTRATPFDRFLAGNDSTLTPGQLNGARLFFTKAQDGGAGCFTCHSGPMLNKQPSDPDVAGIGRLVGENFINVGIGDHPVQALNAAARHHATAYHAEDTGRMEITHDPADAYRFRSLTMRQLKDARTFFHNGSFTTVRDVVSYFNAGVPQDPTAGAATTIDPRFTSPRGSGTTGLGLTDAQIDDITDFLEHGLYDPTLAGNFQPNAQDLAYSTNHPDLAAAGAVDGKLLSGLAIDDNDPLARRDQGLEFLDVTPQVSVQLSASAGAQDVWLLTNTSNSVVDTHLLVIVNGLPAGVTVDAPSTTTTGLPYYRLFLPSGVLNPGQSIATTVNRSGGGSSTSYTLQLMSGQGKP